MKYLKRAWRYLTYVFEFSIRKDRIGGYRLRFRLLPLVLMVVLYKAADDIYLHRETSFTICVWPGLPNPGTTVDITYQRVWEKLDYISFPSPV